MDAAPRKQVKITCPSCGQYLDVTDLPPFEIINCVKCGEKLLVPMQLGNYRLLSTIGGGGMGTVYRAVDVSLGRQVAVKLLRRDLAQNPKFVETFTREARAVAALNHPNIATLYSFGVENGQYYLVMELVPGGSLDDRISRRKRIPEAEVLDIAIQVASGLRHAHQRGLIHRDIKPGNILFTEAGVPKIVDFGLAEFHTEHEAKPAEEGIWGTPYYIAPEKIAGEKEDFRSDIYSLGGTLFHALAGRAPFEATTATDVVLKHMTTPALSLKTFAPDISDGTVRVIGRMLAKNRANRFNSYDTLIQDLQKAKELLLTRGVHRVSEDVKRQMQLNMMRLSLVIAAVVVAIGVFGYLLWTQREQIFGKPPSAIDELAAEASRQTTPSAPRETRPPPESPRPRAVAPWETPWRNALSSLNQGNFAAAAAQFAEARKRMEAGNPLQPWMDPQIGVCLLLAGKTNEAFEAYSAVLPTNGAPLRTDAQPTMDNLPPLLVRAILGRTPAKSLTSKLEEMPEPAQALVRFHLGAKSLVNSEFSLAQKLLDDYGLMSAPDNPDWAWTTAFQFIARKLALECETYVKRIPDVLELQRAREFESALVAAQNLRGTLSYPTLVAAVRAVEEQLQKELKALAEQKRLEDEARQQELLRKDMELLGKIDVGAPAYVANYLFAPLAAAYKQALDQMQTDKGKEEAAQRLPKYQALAELKAFLISQINQRPYTGGPVQTRTGGELKGALYKADEDKVYSKLPYGDIPMPWRNLPPAQVARLAEWYLPTVTDEQKKTALTAALATFRAELKVN